MADVEEILKELEKETAKTDLPLRIKGEEILCGDIVMWLGSYWETRNNERVDFKEYVYGIVIANNNGNIVIETYLTFAPIYSFTHAETEKKITVIYRPKTQDEIKQIRFLMEPIETGKVIDGLKTFHKKFRTFILNK